MRARPARRPAIRSSRGAAAHKQPARSTREHLLEIAGQVFAEKGYESATGKEICERSHANAAAVVYHFGGLENLYRACLQEARSRFAPSEALAAAVARHTDPKERLTAFIGLMVQRLSGPTASSWAARLISREMVSPTPIFDEIRSKEMRARKDILQTIVADIAGLPKDHPTVARSCVNIMAPFGVVLLMGAPRIEKAFPTLSFSPEHADAMTRHMVEYALGGIAAAARALSRQERNPLTVSK